MHHLSNCWNCRLLFAEWLKRPLWTTSLSGNLLSFSPIHKIHDASRLTIKGQSGDDAVLCTDDKTYTLRSVVLSNSVLVVTSPPGWANGDFSQTGVVIRDQVNEILELIPSVPKLYKLQSLLKGREYDEGQEDEERGTEERVRARRNAALHTVDRLAC